MGLFYNCIVGDVAIFEGDACGSFVIFHEMFSSYHGAMVAKREGETGVLVNDYVRSLKKVGKDFI